MACPRVVCTGPVNDYVEQHLARHGRVEITPDTSLEALMERLEGTVCIIVRGDAVVPADVFEAAADLRVIGRTGVGYDNIDIDAATRHGIPVIFTPGAGARAVAEASMACMLALTKRLSYWTDRMKQGDWQSRYGVANGDLDGATLGIVGFGRIGRLVATFAAPFNMKILAHDPFVSAEAAGTDPPVEMVTLEALFESADFITVHALLTDTNRGLINGDLLRRCKPGVYLVNLARGGILDNLDIVCEALDDGRLAGAALDVFDPEPPDFSHPIFRRDDCITAPHAMATSRGAMARIFKSMTDDIVAVLDGGEPRFVVNPDVLVSG